MADDCHGEACHGPCHCWVVGQWASTENTGSRSFRIGATLLIKYAPYGGLEGEKHRAHPDIPAVCSPSRDWENARPSALTRCASREQWAIEQ